MTKYKRDLVLTKIKKIFPHEAPSTIMSILDLCNSSDKNEEGRVRIQLAILKLCQGKIDKLKHYIEIAKSDYRDVIGPAEYPRAWKIGFVGTSKLDKSARQRLIEEDLRQYQDWLNND